jgi:hypothetical protein
VCYVCVMYMWSVYVWSVYVWSVYVGEVDALHRTRMNTSVGVGALDVCTELDWEVDACAEWTMMKEGE